MPRFRRFVFRGTAAAFGGHIVRPEDIIIEAHGAAALPVTGGRSISRVGPPAANPFFNVQGAVTSAEGLFETRSQFLAVTNGSAAQNSLTAVTKVRAEVTGLAVGQKIRFTVSRLVAELISRSSTAGHPSIQLGEVAIGDVAINNHRLIVELNATPYRQFDTYAKLVVAADDPAFVKESGDAFLMRAERYEPPLAPIFFESSSGTYYATIVKSIRWEGAPYPGSRIEGNKVILEPDFGVVYFGEILLSEYARRLTMVRFALGSETGGTASACDVEDNGGWSWTP